VSERTWGRSRTAQPTASCSTACSAVAWSPLGRIVPSISGRGSRTFQEPDGTPLSPWSSVLLERALFRGWAKLGEPLDEAARLRPVQLTDLGRRIMRKL
jgi:hypothetical protein